MAIVRLILFWGLNFIEFMVIIECLASWFPGIHNTSFFQMITKFTSPFLDPIRRFMYNRMGNMMIDFSPIILFIIIDLVKRLILSIF